MTQTSDHQKSPVQPTCADGRDTDREIQRRECASRLAASARFGAEFCPRGNIRDCEAEARPADETAEAEQGQRSAFCKRASARAVKTGHRNQENFCRATARRNGSPLKRGAFATR